MEVDRLDIQCQTMLSKLTFALAEVGDIHTSTNRRDALRALNFLTAALIEAALDIPSQEELRQEAELQSEWIHRYARRARAEYEETGLHVWDVLRQKELAH